MRRALLAEVEATAFIAATILSFSLTPVVYAQRTAPTADQKQPAQASPAQPSANAATTSSAPVAEPATSEPTGPTEDQDAQRREIWESPDMQAAREYIENYASRSTRFTSKAAAVYLAKLERLSPSEMKAWLERFKLKQANLARAAEVARAGRQMAVDQAIARQQAVQQAYVNMKQAQSEAALLNRQRIAEQLQMGREMASARDEFRSEQATALIHARDYRWIFDPPYYTRVMAAATLPGDLPRGDPANFIRGDVAGPEVIGGEAAAATAAAAAAAAGAAGGGGGGAAPP